ncbi:MAG: NFACT family protein [Firmicutes bacterium]|nr:NFACT family protein [Bacillota bacterium]MCL1953311.1 NFACT family protein [Bacillota bacterium]
MPSDALHYYFLTQELNQLLNGGKVNKVYNTETNNIVFAIRANNQNYNLLISCNPNYSRIQLNTHKLDNTSIQSNLCMHIKRHLVGATIKEINTVQYERIVQIKFVHHDELGTKHQKILVAELMGRRSNILLLNLPDMTISDCLYKASIDIAPNRPILVGLQYNPPTPSIHIQNIIDKFDKYVDLQKNPCVCFKNGFCIDWFVHQQLQPDNLDCDEIKKFDTLYQCVDYYFENVLSQKAIQDMSIRLNSTLQDLYKKTNKKYAKIKKIVDQSKDYEKYKILGELLVANIYLAKYGDTQIKVYNYYDNCDTVIQLDPKKSPSQNSQEYFKKYNKQKKAIEISNPQLIQIEQDLDYYKSLQDMIAQAIDMETLDSIEQEMIQSKILITKSTSKYNTTQTSEPRVFEIDGFIVKIGKNNMQNDILYKKAHSTDIWLHAQKIHGSHAVISSRPKVPTIQTITKVAQLVVFFSKAKHTDKVPVDYTQIKNVSKPRGSKPGFVTYANQKTLWVNPSNELLK